jgi:hypothetical protein
MAIYVTGETITSWNSFMQLCNAELTGRWHFRGVLDNCALETALVRAARDWRISMNDLPEIEKALFARVQARSFMDSRNRSCQMLNSFR